jgi:uncharacterized protein (TIGR02145 family)
MSFCTNCGKQIAENVKFCGNCGNAIQSGDTSQNTVSGEVSQTQACTEKSEIGIFFIAIFLGWLGIHQFMVNRPRRGMLYLALGLSSVFITFLAISWQDLQEEGLPALTTFIFIMDLLGLILSTIVTVLVLVDAYKIAVGQFYCGKSWLIAVWVFFVFLYALLTIYGIYSMAGRYDNQISSFEDTRDGTRYKTVKIGNQIWMAENLNIVTRDSKCYNDEPKNCEKYGRLYDWETAKWICPDGWHLPSKEEWVSLENFAGGDNAEKKLKAAKGWDYTNDGKSGNGTDDYGFSALPGGFGENGLDIDFDDVGNCGYWWFATGTGFGYFGACTVLHFFKDSMPYLFSVRCLQGEAPDTPTTMREDESWLLADDNETLMLDDGMSDMMSTNDAIHYVPKSESTPKPTSIPVPPVTQKKIQYEVRYRVLKYYDYNNKCLPHITNDPHPEPKIVTETRDAWTQLEIIRLVGQALGFPESSFGTGSSARIYGEYYDEGTRRECSAEFVGSASRIN